MKISYIKVALALVMGLIIGYFLFSPDEKVVQENHNHEKSEQVEEEWFTCSMHPSVRLDKEGTCPICGMNLIKATSSNSHDSSSERSISLSDEAIKLAGIKTEKVSKKVLTKVIDAPAKIRFNDSEKSTETAQFDGRIELLPTNYIGQKIKNGDKIADIYSADLLQLHSELIEAVKQRNNDVIEAYKTRFRLIEFPDSVINNLMKEKQAREYFSIYAQGSGIVTSINKRVKSLVKKGDVLVEINPTNTFWISAEIPESDSYLVKNDYSMKVNFSNGMQKSLKIDFISPIVNEKTRTVEIRATDENKNEFYRNDLLAEAHIEILLKESITIYRTAVLWTGEQSYVYVKEQSENGPIYLLRKVKIGEANEYEVQIFEGLKESEEVVVNGVFKLDSAAQLAGIPSMMSHKDDEMNHIVKQVQMKKMEESISENEKIALKNVLDKYLNLKNALIETDQEKSTNAVIELKNILTSSSKNESFLSNQDLKKLLLKVSELKKNSDVGKVRKEFINISEFMIHLVKKYSIDSSELYVQFCPMANSNDGAKWLSAEKNIRNPYFGNMMLECGEVLERVK